tara:strand:- start:90 stop:506 length:417 start_codon:yes stop_codon:yes gene_type:complete
MSSKYKKLVEFIREMIRKELAEASTTASAGGEYGTPNAFRNDEKDEDELKLSDGMSVVKEGYYEWKNDDKITTKQKLGRSMAEIRDRITEIEKLVQYNVKLKKEMKFESNNYWKNTTKALNRISEKLVRLSTKIKDLV